ncbi:MAG: bifunctional phosphopantothenoylcysteine decarboxylase/phosphopantothenate--cysteine ligase CoaBC, partial [Desulfatirhabdiaceae bacterium]
MSACNLNNKQVILGVCGGIAAYKSVELLRLLKKQQADVRVIMTQNATRFVGPLTFEALSGMPVFFSVFDDADKGAIRHIDWAQSAQAVVIAPATANMISKLATGLADDALSTFMLAVSCPVLICPSMNTHMYQHMAVQQNINILKRYGYHVLEPDAGYLACGEIGPGRLPDPPEILDEFMDMMAPKDLTGKRVLVTAGPTREFIDPVRFISNPSSGKMGFAMAIAARRRGADVTLVSGPTSLPYPRRMKIIPVQSASDMADAVMEQANQADIVIKTAAVSDYRPQVRAAHKMKKSADELELRMIKNIDILRELGKRKR